jgi:hypothetical protein
MIYYNPLIFLLFASVMAVAVMAVTLRGRARLATA